MNIWSRKFSYRKRFLWPKRDKVTFFIKTKESKKNESLAPVNNYFSFQLIFNLNFLFSILSWFVFYFILILIYSLPIITTEYKRYLLEKSNNAGNGGGSDLSKSIWEVVHLAKIWWSISSFGEKTTEYKKSCVDDVPSFIMCAFCTLPLWHNKNSPYCIK